MSTYTLNSIPSDIVQHKVFPLFSAHELARCSQVCKLWHKFASADLMWQPIIQSISKKLGSNVLEPYHLPTKHLKKFIDCSAINSRTELLGYFKKFSQETTLDQRNRFICASLFDSVYCVVDLGLGNINLSGMSSRSFKADVPPDRVYLCVYTKDQEDFNGDNKLQTKIVNNMGPTANGEGFKISNAFLVLPSGDTRMICDVISKRLMELESQAETECAMYGMLSLVIGIWAASGIYYSCRLF